MKKELNLIINQINECKTKGTVLFTKDSNSFYDYMEKVKKEINGKCVFFKEDLLNSSNPGACIHDCIESAKFMLNKKIDKAIIFIDNIDLISDEEKMDIDTRRKEARFLMEVDKIPSDLNIFLLMHSPSGKKLDEALLKRFYVIDEKQKSLDELLDEGKSFKEINNIYKDKNNER